MKKIIAGLLALTLTFSMVGCGSSSSSKSSSSKKSSSTATTTVSEETTTTTTTTEESSVVEQEASAWETKETDVPVVETKIVDGKGFTTEKFEKVDSFITNDFDSLNKCIKDCYPNYKLSNDKTDYIQNKTSEVDGYKTSDTIDDKAVGYDVVKIISGKIINGEDAYYTDDFDVTTRETTGNYNGINHIGFSSNCANEHLATNQQNAVKVLTQLVSEEFANYVVYSPENTTDDDGDGKFETTIKTTDGESEVEISRAVSYNSVDDTYFININIDLVNTAIDEQEGHKCFDDCGITSIYPSEMTYSLEDLVSKDCADAIGTLDTDFMKGFYTLTGKEYGGTKTEDCSFSHRESEDGKSITDSYTLSSCSASEDDFIKGISSTEVSIDTSLSSENNKLASYDLGIEISDEKYNDDKEAYIKGVFAILKKCCPEAKIEDKSFEELKAEDYIVEYNKTILGTEVPITVTVTISGDADACIATVEGSKSDASVYE